jgi:cytochrome c peroxidase
MFRLKLTIILLFILVLAGQWLMVQADPPINTKSALGKKLFNEKILSKDSSVSCASCHIPEFAFADTIALSVGIHGSSGHRNTPSVLNMKNRPYFFWDGRAATLEQQSLMPIENPAEMGLAIRDAVARLNASPEYRTLFRRIFKEEPNEKNLAAAFGAYEKTLETVDSKFDDWSNDEKKLTEREEWGRELFVGKANCFDCHFMEDFTNDDFKNIGLFNGKNLNDSGRYLITRNPSDIGKFKTPGLRNVEITAPYMHNGMLRTLREVIDYYDDPRPFVKDPINIDPDLKFPLRLTEEEKDALEAFLKSLTDKSFLSKRTAVKK